MTSVRHIESPTTADDRYLDAAREAILAVGWSRTTLTDIARRAGVSRMTLYRRWPDTRALLGDLLTRQCHQLLTGLPVGTPDPDGIADAVVAAVAGLRADPLLRRVVEVDPEELLPYLLQRPGRSQEQVVGVLGELLRAAQVTGTVRAGDPEVLARALLLLAQGFLLSAGTLSGGRPVAAYDAELRAVVQGYLQP